MQVFAATRALAQHFGKQPCVSEDRPGFVLNRMLLPLINEAFFLLMEVRSLQSISCGAEAAQRYTREVADVGRESHTLLFPCIRQPVEQ